MAYCKNCGTQLDEGQNFCPNCGAAQDDNAQGSSNFVDNNNYSKKNVPYITNIPGYDSIGLAIGGLVCGLMGFISTIMPNMGIVGLILCIIGSSLSNKAQKSGIIGGMVTAGKVCSALGIILSIIMIIVMFFVLGTFF